MKKIAIFIETSRSYGRGLLKGVSKYNQENRSWLPYFQPQGLGDAPPVWFKNWSGDGILARIENPQLAAEIISTKVPAVNLRSSMDHINLPFIGSNNSKVAEMGWQHLLSRGYEHFAFCGFAQESFKSFLMREEYFKALVEEAGMNCQCISVTNSADRTKNWEMEQKRLAKKLLELGKPAGILCTNDDMGFRVLEACRRAHIRVPDDIGVLGVDNDEFLCDLSVPKLSSIKINSEETGYLAARYLDEWMKNGSPPKIRPQIPPTGIAVRRSTDVLATSDQNVIAAVRFIREEFGQNINVSDIAQHTGISRTNLENRFKKVLRCSVHQELHRVRLQAAKELLAETDLPIKWVAQESGFKSPQYLTRVFKIETQLTPAEFRKCSVKVVELPKLSQSFR